MGTISRRNTSSFKNQCICLFGHIRDGPTKAVLSVHTSYNSFYKWTKISSLEIIIFELTNDVKKWSRIYFEIDRAPSELLLPSAKISAQNGRIGLAA